jgi:hypothetical protein
MKRSLVFLLSIIFVFSCSNYEKEKKFSKGSNLLEDTEWEYRWGATIFGLGATESYEIAFTATKYIVTKTNKIGTKEFSLEYVPLTDNGPQSEMGSFVITENKTITLIPDSGISVLLAQTDSKKLTSFLDKSLTFFSDNQITDEPPVGAQQYTGLLVGNTLRIGDKKFKIKKK